MKTLFEMKWNQVAISLLIGFSLGTVFGQWYVKDNFHAHWKGKHGGAKQHMLERFDQELQLSDGQKKQVAAIFEAKHAQMRALHAEIQPKFEALRNTTQDEIRKLLNADQQKKFDEMNARMEERRKKHGKFFDGRKRI